MSLAAKPVVAKRAFIICTYVPDSHAVPRPRKPKICPLADSVDSPCIIHLERWRRRKCGIRFAVAGMHCGLHKVSFTVYPPGWVPYARKALILVDHNGAEIEVTEPDCRWGDTVFAAASDAARETLWPEELQLGPRPEAESSLYMSRRTQRRHIRATMLLFGLATSSTSADREVVARLMSVTLLDLEDGSKKIREGPTLIRKSLEAVRVLEKFQTIRLRMAGLLTLGSNQGFWGLALLQ